MHVTTTKPVNAIFKTKNDCIRYIIDR